MSNSSWPRITDLFTTGTGDVALVGAPLGLGSVTPGRCADAPRVVRETLRRFSTYDVEMGEELALKIADKGDAPVAQLMPGDAFESIRDHAAHCTASHGLTLLIGGNNAVTRPAAHGLGVPLDQVGVITLDAHFDLRDTDEGPRNGNPIRCLLEDGLPGRNIVQIGLAPFANTAKMHGTAKEAGIVVITIADVKKRGIIEVMEDAFVRLSHCTALMVDFDIDVIDRAQCPGAPGARPGGMPVDMFFEAARWVGAHRKVKLVDLTEFDPGLDVSDITALTAARWVCEVLAGYSGRA
ncbi:agmatinase family protein [Allosphingosinicella vermicomposti]|uniref:agmatinase family protein n=1 Tax=Allosphingosinicella vermicomposti TaxID=614671 RepID=UPI000D0E7F48|nr:agmatinase family protein [Allosphingosinicella vermicomposti]